VQPRAPQQLVLLLPQPLRLGLLARTRDADFFERAVRRLQRCGERIVARLSSMAAMSNELEETTAATAAATVGYSHCGSGDATLSHAAL
jgi:hypothetical protein